MRHYGFFVVTVTAWIGEKNAFSRGRNDDTTAWNISSSFFSFPLHSCFAVPPTFVRAESVSADRTPTALPDDGYQQLSPPFSALYCVTITLHILAYAFSPPNRGAHSRHG
jgi:hypothetical protein